VFLLALFDFSFIICYHCTLKLTPFAVFVNVYYEFNNYLLDFVFGEHSNLKCAAYGDIHAAAEKTNFGGQVSYPQVRFPPPSNP
jgi:hypothetical protein